MCIVAGGGMVHGRVCCLACGLHMLWGERGAMVRKETGPPEAHVRCLLAGLALP